MPLADRAGLTAADRDAIRTGAAGDDLDGAVLRAVDELIDRTRITDATWQYLAGHLSEHQLMDLVSTAGGYCLLAMAIESFGIEDE